MGEDSIREMRKNRNKSSGLAIFEEKKQEWVFSRIDVSNLQISNSSSTEIHLLPETSPKQFLTVLIRPTTTDTPLSSTADQISEHDMKKIRQCAVSLKQKSTKSNCTVAEADTVIWEIIQFGTNYVASNGTVQAREYCRKFWKALNWKIRDCLEVSSCP